MRTAFFDVDTQLDFLYPAGALYVPGAELIVPNVSRMNRYAAANGIPLISDTDAHAENDPEFLQWPPHCVSGTLGQLKPQSTLLERRTVVSAKALLNAWPEGIQQILLEKQTLDAFSNPGLPAFLDTLDVDRFVVYGVVTEICVKLAAWGLLKTGKRVELVTDAVRHLNEKEAAQTLKEFEAAGGVLLTSTGVLAIEQTS
ncbi:MAG TPA: isochorismatase family cysteine hydrolase [Bryobacteraceae bacterium]|nr:isochorismatase family cysteine hydrolase [Bryobacteraceae bacterium]